MSQFMNQRYNFAWDDMVILTDDQKNPAAMPTRANITRAMNWLVAEARPNDNLFLHFSGHGGQTEDLDGDENDGYDETIYPVDFKKAGMMTDDEMHNILVSRLPAGCRLTAIFDCCHSGSVLDLPYVYVTPLVQRV
jgi:metacaspase-1